MQGNRIPIAKLAGRNEGAEKMIEPEILLQGYRLGIFPMAMEDGEIEWFSPNPRAILPLSNFIVPHGLQRVLRKRTFETRIDTAFARVIRACAEREDTWIKIGRASC